MRHSSSMRSNVSSASSVAAHGRRVIAVVLLNRHEEELHVEVEVKARVQEAYNQVCQHLGLRETEYFGLANLIDGEYHFLDLTSKIQKLAPRSWHRSSGNSTDASGKLAVRLYFRVQFYVEHVLLLKERVSRQLYYLQLLDNFLHYSLSGPSEELCYLLASYALQAELGNYSQAKHTGSYFKPRDYLPLWVIEKRGVDYIIKCMPVMHRDLWGITKIEAQMHFIREMSTSPAAHNLHFYRLKKRKTDPDGSMWLGICPSGLEIYEGSSDGFKTLLSTFLWPNIGNLCYEKKRFEIWSVGTPEGRKFTYYTGNDDWSKYLLAFCSSSHMFQMAMQTKLAEIKNLLAQEKRVYREVYICSRTDKKTENRISVSSNTSSNTTSGIVSDKMHISFDESEDDRDTEIIIDCPPNQQAHEPSSSTPISTLSRGTNKMNLPIKMEYLIGSLPRKIKDERMNLSRTSSGQSERSAVKVSIFHEANNLVNPPANHRQSAAPVTVVAEKVVTNNQDATAMPVPVAAVSQPDPRGNNMQAADQLQQQKQGTNMDIIVNPVGATSVSKESQQAREPQRTVAINGVTVVAPTQQRDLGNSPQGRSPENISVTPPQYQTTQTFLHSHRHSGEAEVLAHAISNETDNQVPPAAASVGGGVGGACGETTGVVVPRTSAGVAPLSASAARMAKLPFAGTYPPSPHNYTNKTMFRVGNQQTAANGAGMNLASLQAGPLAANQFFQGNNSKTFSQNHQVTLNDHMGALSLNPPAGPYADYSYSSMAPHLPPPSGEGHSVLLSASDPFTSYVSKYHNPPTSVSYAQPVSSVVGPFLATDPYQAAALANNPYMQVATNDPWQPIQSQETYLPNSGLDPFQSMPSSGQEPFLTQSSSTDSFLTQSHNLDDSYLLPPTADRLQGSRESLGPDSYGYLPSQTLSSVQQPIEMTAISSSPHPNPPVQFQPPRLPSTNPFINRNSPHSTPTKPPRKTSNPFPVSTNPFISAPSVLNSANRLRSVSNPQQQQQQQQQSNHDPFILIPHRIPSSANQNKPSGHHTPPSTNQQPRSYVDNVPASVPVVAGTSVNGGGSPGRFQVANSVPVSQRALDLTPAAKMKCEPVHHGGVLDAMRKNAINTNEVRRSASDKIPLKGAQVPFAPLLRENKGGVDRVNNRYSLCLEQIHDRKGLDLAELRGLTKSNNDISLPLITALCNDVSLLPQDSGCGCNDPPQPETETNKGQLRPMSWHVESSALENVNFALPTPSEELHYNTLVVTHTPEPSYHGNGLDHDHPKRAVTTNGVSKPVIPAR